jgi:broad specificity phosphatase PhoE
MANNVKHWYIFRHGLATRDPRGYGNRVLTAEVLPEGIPPVRRLGEYLKEAPYDYGVRSEILRCQQTAGIVTEITGRTFVTDSRLNEIYQESFDQVRDRVREFVQEMSTSPYEHVWVCTHGIVIAALRHLLTRGEFAPKDALDYVLPGQLLLIHGEEIEVVRLDEELKQV